MKSSKVKLSDIALKANTSVSTVSLVLNHKLEHRIPNETRQKVLETANSMGYKTPRQKNQPRYSDRNKLISIFFISESGQLDHEYFSNYFLHTCNFASQQDYVIKSQMGGTIEQIKGMFENGDFNFTDGIIFLTFQTLEEDQIKILDSIGKPYLVFNRSTTPTRPSIYVNNVERGYQAAKKHYENGHVSVLHIDYSNSTNKAFEDRYMGAIKAARKYGHVDKLAYTMMTANNMDLSFEDRMDKMLSDHPEATAAIVHSQEMAWALEESLAKRSKNVPEDFSIISLDNHKATNVLLGRTEISSFQTNTKIMSEMSIELMHNLIKDPALYKEKSINLLGDWYEGGSIGPAPKK